MSKSEIPPDTVDYTSLTCTNLMIKMKILTQRLQSGQSLKFLTTKEGNANLSGAFNKNPFKYESKQIDPNLFYSIIIRVS
jgi:hypothetical protein